MTVRKIKLDKLRVGPKIRSLFKWEHVGRLADHMHEWGQLSPLQVVWSREIKSYVILAGNMRFYAARLLGLDSLMCEIVPQREAKACLLSMNLIATKKTIDKASGRP